MCIYYIYRASRRSSLSRLGISATICYFRYEREKLGETVKQQRLDPIKDTVHVDLARTYERPLAELFGRSRSPEINAASISIVLDKKQHRLYLSG